MPPDAPSSLSDAAYLDIVAYMLQMNAFATGRDELSLDAIKSIRIEGRNGPEPMANFALVRVVGCLTEGADTGWMLADASEPVRTKNPAASRDEEKLRRSRVGYSDVSTAQDYIVITNVRRESSGALVQNWPTRGPPAQAAHCRSAQDNAEPGRPLRLNVRRRSLLTALGGMKGDIAGV